MENNIDTDQAYTLGLIVGGGNIANNRLVINLPYRNWGSLKINPERAGEISEYIINTLKPIWKNTYNTDISYKVDKNSWQIFCEMNNDLATKLKSVGLPMSGTIKEIADIKVLSDKLDNQIKIKRFIAGLTDTIGSLAKSHRHRIDANQIISFEFSGKNFQLIADLVNLFSKINCYPDQILWNQPNFHSPTNRYYSTWRKGFKLRIRLCDYMLKGNFVSEAKRLSAEENALLQNATERANGESLSLNGRKTLHIDEGSDWLPEKIRGQHFIHYSHLLYVLGGTVTPEMISFLKDKLNEPEKLFTPFTILTKGTKQEIKGIIESEEYLKRTSFKQINFSLNDFVDKLHDNNVNMIYGKSNEAGFPKNHIMQAITYVVLAQMKSEKVFGTRVKGKVEEEFATIRHLIPNYNLKIKRPDRGTCLLVETDDYAALVGYTDDDFNATLTTVDKEHLRMFIKEPTFEECPLL